MLKKLGILSILVAASAYAEVSVELDKSVINNDLETRNFIVQPKMSKNTFTVTQEQIQEKNYKNVEDVLRDSPGVIVQNTAFGPKIDMRGNGDKSLSKVKVMVDGISINPTEEAMASLPINSIPIESIKKIEIVPGGGATLYGSGSVGGVVNIVTNSNATKDNFFMDSKYGSYDNRSFGFSGGNNITDKLYVNYGFNYINSEGYREGDNTQDTLFLGGFDYKFTKNDKVRFQARHGKQKFESSTDIPKDKEAVRNIYGSKTHLDVDDYITLADNRKAQGKNMDTDQTNESYTLDYEHRFNENFSVGITGYQQKQDRTVTADSTDDVLITIHFGAASNPAQTIEFADIDSRMDAKFKETKEGIKLKGNYTSDKFDSIFGYDYLDANNKRNSRVQSIENLDNYFENGNPKSLTGDSKEIKEKPQPIVNNVDIDLTKEVHSLYMFNKYKANENIDITFGARGEMTQYKGYRKNGPNSGPFMKTTNQRIDTDKKIKNYAGEFGALYRYGDMGSAYARYERGFVTPFASQLTDKVHADDLERADGIDNLQKPKINVASKYVANNIKPETTNTVEFGVRDFIFDTSFVSLSLYATDTTDEIVTINSGVTNPAIKRWKYRNIGKTRRMGFEIEAEQMFDKLTLNQSLSYVDAKIVKGNPEYKIEKGDKIPMVPKAKLTFGAKYSLTDKLSALASYTYTTKRETRELNESRPDPNDNVITTIDKYTIKAQGTVDAGLLYKIDDHATVKFGIKNLLDKKYNLRETSRVGVPAPGRNYYLELNVKF